MFRSAEQENFYARLKAHFDAPDKPLLLEGATGLGKTRAYLAAILHAVSQGKKVAIVLPTHMLIEQLLRSSDIQAVIPSSISVVAFLPRSRFEVQAQYKEHKSKALEADIMLCTSASVIIDQRLKGEYNGVIHRGFIVFDEADQLPEAAALQSDCEVTANDFKELGIKVDSAEQAATEVLSKKDVPQEIKAAALMILEAIDEPAWFHKAGKTDDGGAMLYHRMPGRLLKRLSNQSNVAFISATLSIGGKFDDFKRSMGIAEESHLSTVIEPLNHGSLTFHVSDKAVDDYDWLSTVVSTINSAKKPCLVITPSHSLAESIGSLLTNVTVRQKGKDGAPSETTSDAAKRMGLTDTLVAAGAWAGLDTPIQWKSIVVPRIPYERPIVLDDQIESSFLHTRNTAIRRMRQVIGRGLRTPDACCDIYIIDKRFSNVESFIPQRFKSDWQSKNYLEGSRTEVTLSKPERDPSVRRNALRHYGKVCMACGFQPRVDSQLDVHHLYPLADGGERFTAITDVAVLCANCHRLAHTASPPHPVVTLRVLVGAANESEQLATD
jgi:Rad3-related DNA helicase